MNDDIRVYNRRISREEWEQLTKFLDSLGSKIDEKKHKMNALTETIVDATSFLPFMKSGGWYALNVTYNYKSGELKVSLRPIGKGAMPARRALRQEESEAGRASRHERGKDRKEDRRDQVTAMSDHNPVLCHLCVKEFPYEERSYLLRSEEAIRENVRDVGVIICPRCAEKLGNQGYRKAVAASGHRLLIKDADAQRKAR